MGTSHGHSSEILLKTIGGGEEEEEEQKKNNFATFVL